MFFAGPDCVCLVALSLSLSLSLKLQGLVACWAINSPFYSGSYVGRMGSFYQEPDLGTRIYTGEKGGTCVMGLSLCKSQTLYNLLLGEKR